MLVFCLGEVGVGAGSGAPGGVKCDCFEAFGGCAMALRAVSLTVFVRRVPGRSELFQDAELFGCQWCLVRVGRVVELNGRC